MRTYVEQPFSAQAMAGKYVKIYEKVIKMNGDRAVTKGK
jgi:hypothetical protein